jgi:predicted DNA-binding transcriptional regulator YafY
MQKREKDSWAGQLIEIIEAVKLFSRPQGASNDEVMEGAGVSERQVYRIREALERMGIVLTEVEGTLLTRAKRWQIRSDSLLKLPLTEQLSLSWPELLSLYALYGSRAAYRGTGIEEDLDAAFKKIATVLSPQSRNLLEQYASLFIPARRSLKHHEKTDELLDELSWAAINRKTCSIRYFSFYDEREKAFEINPLHFFERDGGLYLLVMVPRYNNLRTLALERIREVDITEQTFVYPQEFDPYQLLQSAFTMFYGDPVEVVIWFTAGQARYIRERQWAEAQDIIDQPDGSIKLRMTTSGWWDIKRWVLSFGAEAELVAPQEMREEIREELAEAISHYS